MVTDAVGVADRDFHDRRTSSIRLAPGVAPADRGAHWLTRHLWSLAALDAGVVAAALGVAWVVRFGLAIPPLPANAGLGGGMSYALVALVIGLVWFASLAGRRCYDIRVLGMGAEEYKRVYVATLQAVGLIAIVCYLGRVELARGYLALAFPLGVVGLLFERRTARRWLQRQRRHGRLAHRVLVVGSRHNVLDLVAQVRRTPEAGFAVVGACLPDRGEALRDNDRLPVYGGLNEVREAVERSGADTVAVTASPGVTSATLRRIAWTLEGTDVDLVVAPTLTEVAGPRIAMRPVGGLPLLHVEQPEFTGPRRTVKRAFDLLAAGTGFLIFAIPMLLIALAAYLDDRGPILFRQTRVGVGGKEFRLLKFRTMVTDADARLAALQQHNEHDGVLFKIKQDPRVTRVGRVLRRFSLDELPQLVNVLSGQMSLVGPRPPLPQEVARYGDDVRRRLLVKPGITGLWQVSGRSDLSWEDSVRLDLYYVENWSLSTDILICWKTFGAVLASRGAY